MPKIDPQYAHIHKRIYSQLLDELDTEIVMAIMNDPSCEEAVLLNQKVDAAVREYINKETLSISGAWLNSKSSLPL